MKIINSDLYISLEHNIEFDEIDPALLEILTVNMERIDYRYPTEIPGFVDYIMEKHPFAIEIVTDDGLEMAIVPLEVGYVLDKISINKRTKIATIRVYCRLQGLVEHESGEIVTKASASVKHKINSTQSALEAIFKKNFIEISLEEISSESTTPQEVRNTEIDLEDFLF